jgi:hypothetical protein
MAINSWLQRYLWKAIKKFLIRTGFIGPVETVEDHLNYTKFSYFSLVEVAEYGCRKCGKPAAVRVSTISPKGVFGAPVGNGKTSLQ